MGDEDWRWWAKLVLVALGAVASAGLILFGAVRFLDQADRQSARVECIRALVQRQAQAAVGMAEAVLDLRLSVDQRRAAVVSWSEDQDRIAKLIERC